MPRLVRVRKCLAWLGLEKCPRIVKDLLYLLGLDPSPQYIFITTSFASLATNVGLLPSKMLTRCYAFLCQRLCNSGTESRERQVI